MERSKGIILIVVGLAAVLIVWKVAFKPVPKEADSAATNAQTRTDGRTPAPTGRNAAAPSDDTAGQPDASQGDQNQYSRNNRGGRSDNSGFGRGRDQNVPETTMKIVLPDNLSETDLQALYDEYQQISMASRFGGRTGRGGRGGRGGGMMGMDPFGGGYGG